MLFFNGCVFALALPPGIQTSLSRGIEYSIYYFRELVEVEIMFG